MPKSPPTTDAVHAFLAERYAGVANVSPLHGGEWSSAFAFTSAGGRFVVRFGQHPEDYAKDRVAAQWGAARLPVPAFVAMGEAFAGAYAVTEYVAGEKLDTLPREHFGRALESLFDSLAALWAIDPPGTGFGLWDAPSCDAPFPHWRDALCSVAQRDDARLAGWRARLHAYADAERTFDAAQRAVERLAPYCPDVRRVIHDDLLYGNVLVDERDRIAAVLDWGTSQMGDPVREVAMLTFWAPWYPALDAARLDALARAALPVDRYEERLAAGQLHVALAGMQYQAFAGYANDLHATAAHTERLLARIA